MSQHSKQEVNWEFLLASSKSTLQAYEASRLNFAANVRKEIVQLLDAWVSENSNALLARWLIERNLAAEGNAIRTDGDCSLGRIPERQAPVACAPQGAPKPPTRIAPNAAVATAHGASDKIFGDKPSMAARIHAAS